MRFHTPGAVALFNVHRSPRGTLRRALDVLCGAPVPIAAVRAAVACATVPILGVVALLMWSLPAIVDALIAGTTAVIWAQWLDRQGGR